MERVFEFVLNHPLNVFAFAMLVGLLIMTEMRRGGKHWTPKELVNLINAGNSVLIDLRAEKDFQHGHIINSINHPYSKINKLADELKKHEDKEVIVVCANGRQSTTTQLQMKKEGHTVSRLNGGLIEWSVANLPLIKGKTGK